jgi:hypothetical protein
VVDRYQRTINGTPVFEPALTKRASASPSRRSEDRRSERHDLLVERLFQRADRRVLVSCVIALAIAFFAVPALAQSSGTTANAAHAVRVTTDVGGGRTLYSGGTVSYFSVGSVTAGRASAAQRAVTHGLTAFLLGQHDTEPPSLFALLGPVNQSDTNETTLTFSWSAAMDSSPPISYRLIVDTDMAGAYLVDATVSSTSCTAVLATSETYSWRVIASDIRGNTRTVGDSIVRVYSISPPTPTAPIGGETSALTSRLFTWAAGTTTGNHPITEYRLQAAKDTSTNLETPVIDIRPSAGTTETRPAYLFSDTGVYYWRMLTRDSAGRTSGWSSTESFVRASPSETIAPLPPANFRLTSLETGALHLTWDKSPSIDAAQYNVYWDSGLGTAAETLYVVVVQSAETYARVTQTLTHGREYRFKVATSDSEGNQGAAAEAVATARTTAQTVANAVTTEPTPGTLFRQGDSAVQILVTLDGTSGQVDSAATLTFQYRTSPADAWTTMTAQAAVTGNANPIAVMTALNDVGQYRFVWDPSALGADTYDMRAIVTDLAGETSVLTAQASTIRLVNAATESPTVITNLLADGYQYQRIINAANAETFILSNNHDTQSVTVNVPPQAFLNASDTANVYMSVSIRSSSPFDGSLNSATRATIGDAVEVTLSSSDTALAVGKTATIRITFRDNNQDGFVDGTRTRWNTLKLYRHPGTAAGTWEELTTTADTAPTATRAGWIEARTTRFSIFRLVGVAAEANLNAFIVAPNPYRPNDGNPATGLPYTGAAGTGIYFSNLPASVRIEVFTITGRKVMEFQTSASTGQAQWNVKNSDGRDVASGVYLYRIHDLATGQSVTGKLTVIR